MSDDLFLCQVSKGSAVWSEFNIFCTLVPWQRPPFWIYSTPQKLPLTMVDIPTKFHEVWWKESKIFLNLPFLVSMATATKFVQPILIFFGLSRSTWCGCCSYQASFINFCLASNLLWSFLCFSFFKHFGHFHGNSSHFEKINPLKAQLHMAYDDIPTRFHKVWSRYLREMCQTNFWRKKERRRRRIITRIAIAKQ